MFNSLKGLVVTLVSTMNGLRAPVTRQYPDSGNLLGKRDEPTPVKDRFMGFQVSNDLPGTNQAWQFGFQQSHGVKDPVAGLQPGNPRN